MNLKNFNHQSNVFFGCNIFGRDFCSFVQRVSLPGITYNNIELSKTAVRFFKQGDTAQYDTLTVDLIIDEELYVWKEIVKKLQTMTIVGNGDQRLSEYSAFLHIFNEKDKSILRLDFVDVILENLSSVEFDTSGDDAVLTMTLTFSYAFYTITDKSKFLINDLSEDEIVKGYRKRSRVIHLENDDKDANDNEESSGFQTKEKIEIN